MRIWEKSQAYAEYLGFIFALNEVVEGVSISEGSKNVSPRVESILKVLDKLDHMIDDIPPIQQPQRFGNQAFRTWYQRLQEVLKMWIIQLIQMHIYIFNLCRRLYASLRMP